MSTPTVPNIWGVNAVILETFDAAWWASQPPSVQALKTGDLSQQSYYNQVVALAVSGIFIDGTILIMGEDPYIAMLIRQMDGYTTYPDFLNSQTKVVSLNPADYPPYPVPIVPEGQLVGPIIGFGPYYFTTNLATPLNTPAGTKTTGPDGAIYTAVYIQQLMLNGQTQTILRWLHS